MRCSDGTHWPVHHVDPRQYGGHPTDPNNLIPVPPGTHSEIHYAYRVCEGKSSGTVDYSKPGKKWPHSGGRDGFGIGGGLPEIPSAPGIEW